MAGLPRKYAKMGFKKGWRAYKATRSKTRTKVKVMARRRKSGRFYRARKAFTKKRSFGFSFSGITKVAVGAFAAVLYEVFLSPKIPLDGTIKNFVELGVGILLMSMPRMPTMVRSFGTALAIVNAYAIIYPYVANWSGSGSTNGSAWG